MTISATTQGLRPGACTSTNRPAVPYDGMVVYETDTNTMSVYDGTNWASLSGPISLNFQTISVDYTMPTGYNGLSSGPITIASGVTVTVPSGSSWSIV